MERYFSEKELEKTRAEILGHNDGLHLAEAVVDDAMEYIEALGERIMAERRRSAWVVVQLDSCQDAFEEASEDAYFEWLNE